MGAKDSKACLISYDEAVKRLHEFELKRLTEAFKHTSNLNTSITRQAFIKEVLGEFVPPKLAEHIFQACGGTNKGITFKEIICGLVILTRGRKDERYRFLFNLCANETGTYVSKQDMFKLLQACDGGMVSDEVVSWFKDSDKMTFEEFRSWLLSHENASSLTRWLLNEAVALSNDLEMPTFYQTLAGVTHLEEKDIIELEKHYWFLKTKSKTGKFDLETLRPLILPCIASQLCQGVFNAFDENQDGHIDFKEMACGISACCRGPLVERLKFCFKIFDANRDGILTLQEVRQMVYTMLYIQQSANPALEEPLLDCEEVVTVTKEILSHGGENQEEQSGLTLEQYLVVTVSRPLAQDLLEVLSQVCHVALGLRPASREMEGRIIRGWLDRENLRGLYPGQIWYLVAMSWWNTWNDYVDHKFSTFAEDESYLTDSLRRNAKLQKKIEGSVAHAQNGGNGVVLSSITSLPDECSDLPPQYELRRNNGLQLSDSSGRPSPNSSHIRKLISIQPPSMIDNSSLVVNNAFKAIILTQEGGRLRQLQLGVDFALVSEAVWHALCQWYGGAPALPRQVIQPPGDGTPELELYLISLKLFRHQPPSAPKPAGAPVAAAASSAWSGAISAYTAVGGSGSTYPTPPTGPPRRYLAYLASFSRLATLKTVFEFLCKRLRLRHEDARLWQMKDESNLILLDDENSTLEELGIQDHEQVLIEVRNKDQTWPEEVSCFINAKLSQKSQGPTEKGATGLNNLGNTCFMNAAVQCVSNTQPLTKYFILDKHLYELNRTNPLGMKGHIAKRYGDLVHDLWSGASKTIAPLKLRWTIAKYAPRFNGFLQHDSQEFLAFLMDGLHEDLNRVHVKPYVKLKDSDGRPDKEVAQEAWENHLLRNRSIIVDLFHGQLQSTVRCEVCGHASVRFDPFNYLSLPLPMEGALHLEVVVMRVDGSVPVKYGLRLSHDDQYSVLKQQLSELCSIPPPRLLLTEISGSTIKNVLQDEHRIKLVSGSLLFAYEICCLDDTFPEDLRQASSLGEVQRLAMNGTSKKLCNGDAVNKMGEDINSNPEPNDPPSLHNSLGTDSSDSMSSSWSSPGEASRGHFLVAYHRKMIRQELYFLAWQKTRPALFGLPVLLPYDPGTTTYKDVYVGVWRQVARLVSPPPPHSHLNHALDCDNSLGYEFPFTLKIVTNDGLSCAICPWYRFCQGCPLECSDLPLGPQAGVVAIDWDPTALHLRYQASMEMVFVEDSSVATARARQTEPISLQDCLDAFTKEERLEEKYMCSRCNTSHPASKKLLIWRLPPILIIHLKRFQQVQNKWVKSHKMVRFPFTDFDPTDYLAPIPKKMALGAGDHAEWEDIHQHRMLLGENPKSLKYRLYAVACHSGILGGGHYVCYACNPNNKWYCYNDSSCKEARPEQIDSAYMLLYERETIDYDQYMPDVTGKQPDLQDLQDDDFESDFRKFCSLQ